MRRARDLPRLATLFLVLSAACAGGKGAADAAVKAADDAVASLPTDAAQVLPEALAPITQAVQTAKDQVTKGDYQLAVTTAKDVPAQVQALVAQLPAKRAELTAVMDTLSIAMPRNLAAMKTKLDALAKTKKLPQGMDAQQLQAANDTYAAAITEWGNIMASHKSGDLASAHARALDLKARVSQTLVALGLTSDERAWSNATQPPR
jgi:hypothetical protein